MHEFNVFIQTDYLQRPNRQQILINYQRLINTFFTLVVIPGSFEKWIPPPEALFYEEKFITGDHAPNTK